MALAETSRAIQGSGAAIAARFRDEGASIIINDLRDALDNLDTDLVGGLASAPEEALDPLVTALAGLSGLTQESMIRSVGWRFMDMGKRIERALQTITTVKGLLSPVSGDMEQGTLLTAMLTSMEALITYRRRGRERRGLELGLDGQIWMGGDPDIYKLKPQITYILPTQSRGRH